MAERNVTSDGLRLHAKEFLDAAEILLKQTPNIQYEIQFPIYFLLGRSIELSLKSFLLGRGMSPKEIKKLSHDINALFVEALNRDLQNMMKFDIMEKGVIPVLNIDYKSKTLEYRDSAGMYHAPNIVFINCPISFRIHPMRIFLHIRYQVIEKSFSPALLFAG
jgi:hypothetical protein